MSFAFLNTKELPSETALIFVS